MDSSPRTALVDESFRRGHDGRGYYLMAAVVVPDVHRATITHDLRRLLPRGQKRWHFRDEDDASQRNFFSAIGSLHDLEVLAVAAVEETPTQRKSERARVRCIWTLLENLHGRGVQSLVIESREERNDRKDRREIISAQQAGVANPHLVYAHGRPKDESLLWVADAIAGSVGSKVAHNEPELLELLPDGMCEICWVAP